MLRVLGGEVGQLVILFLVLIEVEWHHVVGLADAAEVVGFLRAKEAVGSALDGDHARIIHHIGLLGNLGTRLLLLHLLSRDHFSLVQLGGT